MTIDEMVESRTLDRVQPSPRHAARLLAEAQRHVVAAATLVELDAIGAYQLAYDASRKAAMAVLADRGLRPTARGGHLALVRAIEALDEPGFDRLDSMRRRRNKLEYPGPNDHGATPDDARAAIEWAHAICEQAAEIAAASD